MPANTPRGYTYPLYGDVANFPAQIQDFAQDVDLDVEALSDEIAAITGAAPSVRVSATANQSIAVSTDTFATFAVEDYDNNAMGNLGVNNDRITFTTAGIYLVEADVNWTPNGNATLNGRKIVLDHSTLGEVARDSRRGSQALDTETNVTTLIEVPAASFIRVLCRQNSGAAVNITARSLSATKVAGF